jgi:hypothetical protein
MRDEKKVKNEIGRRKERHRREFGRFKEERLHGK